MKRLFISLMVLLTVMPMMAQQVEGWPANYGGVMLQAFSWDKFDESQWTVLESQADELAPYFSLVWIPQSGNCDQKSMGYDDFYWFPGGNHYTSSFGTEAQLRSMISTFKQKGIGTIADVVINHRKSNNGWFGFPTETYNGVTYSMDSKDVCSNDDGGKAKQNNPTAKLGNPDTGTDWDGMRDLDHTSTNVQNTVKAYLDMLLNDLGYTGFRYDMVMGYAPKYTEMYNKSSQPLFSVGELWSGTLPIRNWILGTNKTSAAFDFQFKYVVKNAATPPSGSTSINYNYLDMNNGDYDGHPNYPLISNQESNGQYRQWAVTFIENHDTQLRPDGSSNGPLTRDTISFNAYMLALPGTPCVFLPHWADCKQDIKSQILVRQLTGIVNTSNYEIVKKNMRYFVTSTEGTKSKLLCYIGDQTRFTPEANWVKVLEGPKYSYWVDRAANTAWISHASGTYEVGEGETLNVMVSAVTDNETAQLVYTTDGTEPTASSAKAESGSTISIPDGTTTLKVGLLVNNSVSTVQTRTYTIKEPYKFSIPSFCTAEDGEVCAFFEALTSWTVVKCWAWDANGNNYTGGEWPGAACTFLGTAENGKKVWKWSYDGSLTTMPTKIIFNNNNNGSQTADLDFHNAGYYISTGEWMGTVSSEPQPQPQQNVFVGGDISVLQSYEDQNVAYYDENGKKITDVLKYMKSDAVGWNAQRVRLFVNPNKKAPDGSTDAQVCQDIDYVIRLSKRIKEEGFALMLDFHYSDTWADPSNQWTPAAWTSLSEQQLQTKIYDYTKECLEKLVAAGATPDFIQTGNEISYGMLWGAYGTSSPKKCTTGSSANWDRFVNLLKQASKACREVCPKAQIVIHTERTGVYSTLKGIYNRLADVDYDVIGLSYYPFWHNGLNVLSASLNSLAKDFPDKKVQIVETAYYYQWQPSDVTYNFASTWPITPAGQAAFAADLVAELKKHDNVNGLYWWFPEENGNGPNSSVLTGWVNRGFWDNSTHKALPGLYALKDYCPTTLLGDVNGDGKVDVSDYIGVANYILNIPQEGFNEKAADVNGDGAIDVSDYLGVANIILTGSPYGTAASR